MVYMFLLLLFLGSSTADLIWTATFDCSRINRIFCCTSRVRSLCTEQCQGVPCGPKYYQNLFSTDVSNEGIAEVSKNRDAKTTSEEFRLNGGVSAGNSDGFETDQLTLVEGIDSTTSFPYHSSPSFMQPFVHFLTERPLPNHPHTFTQSRILEPYQPSLSTSFPTLIPFDPINFDSHTPVMTETSSDWPEITTTKPLRRRTTPDPRIIKPPESLVIISDYDQDEPPTENAVDLTTPEESSRITHNQSGTIMPISSIDKEESPGSINFAPHLVMSEQKRRPNWSISILPHTENRDKNVEETFLRVPNFSIDGEAGQLGKKNEVQSVIDTVINSFSLTSTTEENTKENDKVERIANFIPSYHKETLEVISSGTATVIPVIRTTLSPPATTSLLLPFRNSLPSSEFESLKFSIHRVPEPISASTHGQSNLHCGVAPNFIPCVSSQKASEALLNCCQQKNLPSGCLRLCRYDITQTEVRTAIDRGQCGIFNVAPFLECATQGKDNLECCRYKGVITKSGPQCEQFCRPSAGLTPLGLQHIVCGNVIGEMLQCHHSGVRE